MDNGPLSVSYLQDHLGATSQLVNALNGQAKARYDYASYGKLEDDANNPVSANPFTYTGREDDGTGLMYYRARYYDSELEIFISQDPLGDKQRYVGGNPVRFIDPLGLEAVNPAVCPLGTITTSDGEVVCRPLIPPILPACGFFTAGGAAGGATASAVSKVPNLNGKTWQQINNILNKQGFRYQGATKGGYQKFYHPDGSRIQIRPNGEVIRTAPKKIPDGGGKPYRPRIGPDGKPTPNHNTGEFTL